MKKVIQKLFGSAPAILITALLTAICGTIGDHILYPVSSAVDKVVSPYAFSIMTYLDYVKLSSLQTKDSDIIASPLSLSWLALISFAIVITLILRAIYIFAKKRNLIACEKKFSLNNDTCQKLKAITEGNDTINGIIL